MELLISILVKQTKDEVLKAQKHDKRVISLDPESSSEEEEDLNEEGGQIILEGEAGKEEKKLESKIQKQIFDDLKDDVSWDNLIYIYIYIDWYDIRSNKLQNQAYR